MVFRLLPLLLLAAVHWCCCEDTYPENDDYTFPENVPLTDGQTFEYIVVGAGGAGCPVAARLALAGKDTLLVEAGDDPTLLTKIPGTSMVLRGGSVDWQYDTLTNHKSCLSYRNQQCRFSRGLCLGGSTSINYMMYTRGSPRDWDDLGVDGWTWDDVRPYFLRYEGLRQLDRLPLTSIPYHNTTGTMRIEFFSDPENPWHSRLLTGYQDLNIPLNPDINAESQVGVSHIVGYVYKNERMSTARGYLCRPDVKARLKVAKSTQCTGVILDENNVAKGITVVNGPLKTPLRLYATKEVILSAGAIGSPQILQLSGIGPSDNLKEFNIPVKLDLPVGDELTDHSFAMMFIQVDKGTNQYQAVLDAIKGVGEISQLASTNTGPLTSDGLTDVTTFYNADCYDFENHRLDKNCSDYSLPNLQHYHVFVDKNFVNEIGPKFFQHGIDLNDNVLQQIVDVNTDHGIIMVCPVILRPYSAGTVRLASSDPLVKPAITPNFLADDRDVKLMMKSAAVLEDLMQTEEFKSRNASLVYLELEGCPKREEDNAGYWECYVRHLTHTTCHSVGTTGLGRVLDAQLRVKGAKNLRVCDLGSMPKIVRANTAATAIAYGERCADMILKGQ